MGRGWLALGFAAALGSLAAPASAQQWVEYARGANDGFPLFYDPSRVRYDGNVAVIWTRNNNAAQPVAREAYRVSRMEIDCADETTRTVYTAAYAADGAVVASDDVPTAFAPVPPGSMVEALMQRVCRRGN